MSFRDVKRQVLVLLEADERCRNNDRYLYVRLLERFHEVPSSTTLERWIEAPCPDFESVRRSRAYVQSEGRFPPTSEKVAEARGRDMVTGVHVENEGRECEFRQELGYPVASSPAPADPGQGHLFGKRSSAGGEPDAH